MRSAILKSVIGLGVVLGTSAAVYAENDPISVRKTIMQSVGASAGLAGGLTKGEIEYTPAAGKAAIAAFYSASVSFGNFFPEGSESGGETTAAPAIWENRAGFDAEIEKLKSASMAAFQAAGKDGPADLDAFKASVGPIFGTCKSCHEGFRVKN